MPRLLDDYDLLWAALDPETSELAREALKAQGMPSLLHSAHFDGAYCVRTPPKWQLYVPKGARARARDVLAAAWGEQSIRELDADD